ncbi:DNA (cytosine-5-)-methyltransferase, partial [Candidatus Parcubacteria bacterium]
DKPAPTIMTEFITFGIGRYGHPEQDRAISLREGAILQGFPEDYEFVPPDKPVYLKPVARMIGNAVPPPIGKAIAEVIKCN